MRHLLTLLFICLLASPSRAGDLVSVSVGQPIAEVLDAYRELGYPFVYSSNLVGPDLRVKRVPMGTEPVEMVRKILAPHGLALRDEAGALLVVRAGSEPARTGTVLVVVTGDGADRALADPAIQFEPRVSSGEQLAPGVVKYTAVPAGSYALEVAAGEHVPAQQSVVVSAGESTVVALRLDRAKPRIDTISVSASRYEILRDIAPSGFSIDQRSVETMPDIGDDPLRAVQRLPGAAASGVSARTYLRGGDDREVGIVLNGLRLFDPFHVRDFQSIFSAIDSRALEGVEVYTGGFPVRYGNRMSGMVLMDSLEPLEDRHTEIGVSVYNTSLLMTGGGRDQSWLVSARRGNLDLVIDPEFGSPAYHDAFAEYRWELSPDMTVTLNALYASDRVEIILETDPEELERVLSETGNVQAWLQAENRWSEALSSRTVLSATWFDNLRRGSLGDQEKIVANVFDDRRVVRYGFRQDFLLRRSQRHLLQWGLEVRHSDADYEYRSNAEYFGLPAMFEGRDEPLSRDLSASPNGGSYALYFADRWRLTQNSSIEWGLRWDDQTYTDLPSDAQLSPRLSFVQSIGESTEIRLSWGRYHQAQEVNELQIEDGITNFWPAQRADHLIAGLRHRLGERTSLRVEVFDKRMEDVQPRFENLYDPLGVIPEVQADRVRLDPEGARSRGVEFSVDRTSGPWNWWATYTLSKATDRIAGRDERRSWDQRHAFVGGVGYSDQKWDWGLVANVHSGWPLTELTLIEDGIDEDGDPEYVAIPGPRNAGRHDTFVSVDLRIARKWQLERGSFSAFLEVSNLLNRRNPCCLDWDLEDDGETGQEVLERGVDYWMPLLPAVGVLWEF